MTDAQRKRNKRFYMKRLSEGKCVACGKADERTQAGAARCAECNLKYHPKAPRKRDPKKYAQEQEDKKEIARMRKKAHVCIACGAIDERTMSGKCHCKKCAFKRSDAQKEDYRNGKRKQQEKARRERWREQGLCTVCGGRKSEPEFKMCIDCRVRVRMRKRRDNFEKGKLPRGANGMCYQCNRKPALEGKKLCGDCYKMKLMLPQNWKGASNDGNNHNS